jgi:plastocyanin
MRIRQKDVTAQADVLEVRHHEIPDTAAAAGAPAIPSSYDIGGITWRRMLRGIAIAEAVGLVTIMIAAMSYGMSFFFPGLVAAVLWVGAAFLLPRMTKASAVTGLVIASLTLLMFGGAFFAWTGFLSPTNWFEMSFAALSTIVPIAGIVAAIATLRHRDGTDAARTPSVVVALLTGAVVLTGIVGSVASSDPTRLPGDVELSAMDFEFDQDALSADAGDVAIYFENNDGFAHNVEIKGQGASDKAAGRSSVRHVFKDLSAGNYEYFCAIHPDMKGTLTVS